MKLNKYLLMAAMGLGLVACTENDLVEGGDSNGAQNEGTTYVGFSLKFNASNTRATGEEDGTEAEQKINTAYVLMTDASDKIEKVLSFTGDNDKGVTEGEGYYKDKGKFLFKTSAGVHHFYAVVNPETVPTENTTIDDYFKQAVTLEVDEIPSIIDVESSNFMMASEDVLIASVEDGVTEEEALDGPNNSYTIYVERVSAKVTMT